MSLRFCFGPSGSGKSYKVYSEIIERSALSPKQNFLIVVPDQFTMQTQKELVSMHPCEGIMNIDVLSFGRLSHRIFEEVGGEKIPVLDDTGKSLVLQRVAASIKEELPALGSHLHKQGYIHEVKSAISEFMQYGLSVEDVGTLTEFAQKRGALYYKLKDLRLLYESFLEYIKGHFITTEERMDVLCRKLVHSEILKGSVVVFDGFTGFTPIQNRLIQEIMSFADEVLVTITLCEEEKPFEMDGEQKLFYLSKKNVCDLERLAKEAGVERGTDLYLKSSPSPRFREKAALSYLEKNLFRAPAEPFAGKQESLFISEAPTTREEVHQAGLQICELIRKEGLQYRDIALICSDLESYAPFVEREFADMGIPCYLDRTKGIVLNPMIEYIKSALELYTRDFSYESVFHYLRSGLAEFTTEEVDILENYIIQTGIRGKNKWNRLFTHKIKSMGEDEEALQQMNELRNRFMEQVSILEATGLSEAQFYVENLYQFLVQNSVQEKLQAYEKQFTELGDLVRAKEYGQIYRLVIELLDQIYGLLGEEQITLQEFLEILVAGFGEIEVGTIPQNVDRILVGDMERTRLKQVKVLFFLGVNDGNIPRSASKGGIISDMDREFLKESDLELAPTPRQQMFIQRFYLYLNLTKPSDKLFLSYSKVNGAGKTLRPSYLIETIRKMFPGLIIEQPFRKPILEQLVTPKEGVRYLAQALREYVENVPGILSKAELFALYQTYEGMEDYEGLAKVLKEAAFYRYEASGLSAAVARALYGQRLENSVSRLETYAACAYHHFLQYGLSLQEREEFGFEAVDMGNIFHGVLDEFARRLEDSEYTWFDFPQEFGESQVAEAMEQIAAEYGAGILYSSARQTYGINRMQRILNRTVDTLQKQLQKGKFVPMGHEISFRYVEDLAAVDVTLSQEEKMRLTGRIDRVDVAEEEEKVYVKVIDYKSGTHQFQLASVYYGLQLQLVVYMNAAMELVAKKYPDKEVVPAALLYYHVEDPVVEAEGSVGEEDINEMIQKQLRMSGVVNGQDTIVELLDKEMTDKSLVIPVERKKDGSFSTRSSIMSGEELSLVSDYVNHKVREIGREILAGHKEINPYETGKKDACEYCAYKKVCGFDSSLPGYEKRRLEENEQDSVYKKMKEVLD